jgi:hypothetical protein
MSHSNVINAHMQESALFGHVITYLKSTPNMRLAMSVLGLLCYIVGQDLRLNLSNLDMCYNQTLAT